MADLLARAMTGVMLRRATQLDANAIGALHVASWKETYAGILPDAILANLSVDGRAAMWRQVLEPGDDGRTVVIVVEDREAVVGFGSCGPQRDAALADGGFDGEFGAIYLLRSHQGRGVGRSIMVAMSEAPSEGGYSAASLWVLHENERARRFYERLGGVVIGTRTERNAQVALVEEAYGWPDLKAMIG